MKISLALSLGLLLVISVSIIAAPVSKGSVVVNEMAIDGPSDTVQGWRLYARDSVLLSVSAGVEPGSFPSPDPFSFTLVPRVVSWNALTVVTNKSVWLGEEITNTSSSFYGQNGNMVYFPLVAKGDGIHRINAQSTSYVIASTDGDSLGASGVLSGLNYDGIHLMGGLYGLDGQISTGTFYGTGNLAPGDTPVDWFIYLGAAVSWNGTDVGLKYVQDWVTSFGSIDVTASYTVYDSTGGYTSSQELTVVPEPATLSILGIGAIALIRRRSKK